MPDQIAFINMQALWRRALLIVPFVAASVGVWYGVRWCVGNTMADYAPDEETAQAAVRLAPGDPAAHLQLARYKRISFLPEEIPESLRHYEEAARLAPHDYHVWMEWGRALWEAGASERSLEVLRRAVELAPNYASPHWHLGNMLLREGRLDEAFAELRRASDADPTLRPQIFNMAWMLYKEDLPRVLEAVGNSPRARAQLIEYFINLNRLDDARSLWAGLSAAERRGQPEAGRSLLRALFNAGRYHATLEVQRDLGPEGAGGAVPEKILNGGFEADIAAAGTDYFDWQVTPVKPAQFAQVAVDSRTSHNGRSLRIAFSAVTNFDFNNVSQLVLVEPSARYRLSFYVRTENLKSANPPVVVVLDTPGGPASTLGSSKPLAVGTSDWQPAAIEFTTGPKTEAITVRLTRPACPGEQCPLFGKVWYDDFDLQRLSGGTAAGTRRN